MIGIALELGIGLDPPRRLVAVHDRKLDVHQDQVGPLRSRRRSSASCAVLRLDHVVAGAGQQIAQDLPVVLLVLDHENAFAHGCLACSTLIGSVSENVEPWPGRNSTQIRPPCISMIRLEIASPSPVPPLALVIELSACWNSWKSFCWSASEMPGPVSRTARLIGAVRRRGLDRDLALVGELDGVADQIEQHLGQAALVAAAGRQVLRHVDLEARASCWRPASRPRRRRRARRP